MGGELAGREQKHTEANRDRGLSTAAADDFCDCPEGSYLGTGWVEETMDEDQTKSAGGKQQLHN